MLLNGLTKVIEDEAKLDPVEPDKPASVTGEPGKCFHCGCDCLVDPLREKGMYCDCCAKLRWGQTCLTCSLVAGVGEMWMVDTEADQHALDYPEHQMLPSMLRSVD